ncbi:hypothetical protein LINGRAHAP2_LOCUS3899 [Linum grandiflorum]
MLRFRLGGEDVTLTQDQIGLACGFYTHEDLSQGWYQSLVTDMSLRDMSPILGHLVDDESGWTAGVSKATNFWCKAYHYLHRVLTESISGRTESMGAVLNSELAFIYTLKDGSQGYHLGCLVAATFSRFWSNWNLVKLLGGSYVTCFARFLGRLDRFRDVRSHLPAAVGVPELVRMKMLVPRRRSGRTTYSVSTQAQEAAAEEAEMEEMVAGGLRRAFDPTIRGPASIDGPTILGAITDLAEGFAAVNATMDSRWEWLQGNLRREHPDWPEPPQ